jgi:glyceraldehyde-3-phosphate dehydrogenase (NADP+)
MNHAMFIGGRFGGSEHTLEVRNPYDDKVVGAYSEAGPGDVEDALRAMESAAPTMRSMPSFERCIILLGIRDKLAGRREEMARTITLESAKPITDARIEVDRALNVLALSAEEAKRNHGETMPLDLLPNSKGRWGLTRRFAIGPIVGISPFNFPLNLGMHKVGPAIASGNAITWKPPRQAPGAAFLFAELVADSGLPAGALNVICPPDNLAEALATDSRVKMLSFTGSARVGWGLRAKAGSKKVALELGGNAAVLVAEDADLDHAAARCAAGGFTYAGQVCISTQRILAADSIYKEFLLRLIPAVESIRVGDPLDEETQMGPMINEKEASRVETGIREAVDRGARVLTGGIRNGLIFKPTILADVTRDSRIYCEEAFGPVVTVEPFRTWEEGLARANDSVYGLQAGVFTRDIQKAMEAFHALEVGGVILNDVPSYRMDSMPYGGIKESGLGREGIRFAIEEMTETRILVLAQDWSA